MISHADQVDHLERTLDVAELPVLQTRKLGLKPQKIKNQVNRGLEPTRSRSRRRLVAVRLQEKQKAAELEPRKQEQRRRERGRKDLA